MRATELCYLDASELATKLRAREISSEEVVRAHLGRLDAINPKINAIVTVAGDAIERARAADRALGAGAEVGPLHGIPVTIKDSLDTAGLRTARGSRLFADHIPSRDAPVVARLKAAGAIVIGKTNLPEFSYARESVNALSGRTVNPWNRERTPGGSSGGDAAAVAAGLSPLGIGSDVALSIRVPAHFCGIVGLKPTHGRVPFTGHWPQTLRRFWHVGPMARSVRDVTLALEVVSGPDAEDGYAVSGPPSRAFTLAGPPEPMRVGWMADPGFGPVDANIVATVAEAARALSESGCHVEPAHIPVLDATDADLLSATLFAPEAIPYFTQVAAGREPDLHAITRRVIAASTPSRAAYVAAELAVENLRDALATYFHRFDALLCPVAPLTAYAHDTDTLRIGGATLPNRHIVRCTALFNLTGSPALSVPFALSREGLPIGVQIVGRQFEEATVLALGTMLERARTPRFFRPIP
jgi:Asp-tRNA(Asn)/Glu-tRNA(Gln) amidotransferase A subunit family amidase